MNVFSNSQELLNFIILKTFFFKVQRLGRSTPSSKLCSHSLNGPVFPMIKAATATPKYNSLRSSPIGPDGFFSINSGTNI